MSYRSDFSDSELSRSPSARSPPPHPPSRKQKNNSKKQLEKLKGTMLEMHNLYQDLKKDFDTYREQTLEREDKYRERIHCLEREKLLMEGKIQVLTEARSDLQERYNELKLDYRNLIGKH
jgi:hypothetical protein